MITWAVICLLGGIWHLMMFTLLYYDNNRSTSLWEINVDVKYIMSDEGWYERSIFNVVMTEVFMKSISAEPGDHYLPNALLWSSNVSYEK